jgi:hypothetical protein
MTANVGLPRWPALLVWLGTRALLIWLLAQREHSVIGDLRYYADSLHDLHAQGVANTLVEYPVPGFALVALPYALLDQLGHVDKYTTLVPALAVLTDLAFLGMLMRARRWGRHDHSRWSVTAAEWVWLIGVPALGATAYARFDLMPGILVGVAVLYAAHRPAFAGVMAACATSLKYWPAMVLPAVAAPRQSRLRVLAGIAVAGGVLAIGSFLAGGWDRLFSPFTWQGDRGLQVESISSTPLMIIWSFAGHPWHVGNTPHNAVEIMGPGVSALEWVCRLATIVVALGLGWVWWTAWRHLEHPGDDEVVDAVVWMALAAVLGFVVTSKVFSPQYLLWALPAAAAGLAVLHDAETWRRLAKWSAWLVLACGMTHVFFPLYYGGLAYHTGWSIATVALLAARNLIIVCLFVAAFREAWRVLHTTHVPRSVAAAEADEPVAR